MKIEKLNNILQPSELKDVKEFLENEIISILNRKPTVYEAETVKKNIKEKTKDSFINYLKNIIFKPQDNEYDSAMFDLFSNKTNQNNTTQNSLNNKIKSFKKQQNISKEEPYHNNLNTKSNNSYNKNKVNNYQEKLYKYKDRYLPFDTNDIRPKIKDEAIKPYKNNYYKNNQYSNNPNYSQNPYYTNSNNYDYSNDYSNTYNNPYTNTYGSHNKYNNTPNYTNLQQTANNNDSLFNNNGHPYNHFQPNNYSNYTNQNIGGLNSSLSPVVEHWLNDNLDEIVNNAITKAMANQDLFNNNYENNYVDENIYENDYYSNDYYNNNNYYANNYNEYDEYEEYDNNYNEYDNYDDYYNNQSLLNKTEKLKTREEETRGLYYNDYRKLKR